LYSNSFPRNIICSALIENNEVKSTDAEAIGGTVIRVTTQTHNIILYTAIILTFGLRDFCGLRCFGFLYEEIRIRESMMIEHELLEGTLTFCFSFPLCRRGFTVCADLCEARQVGFSLVSLALDMQLAEDT
jgi:hypothetical protein